MSVSWLYRGLMAILQHNQPLHVGDILRLKAEGINPILGNVHQLLRGSGSTRVPHVDGPLYALRLRL